MYFDDLLQHVASDPRFRGTTVSPVPRVHATAK